jgi:hypothetical protein
MTASTQHLYQVETIGSTSFAIWNTETREYVQNRFGFVRYFSTRSSARKAITRLNRPAGDRHR